MLKKLGSALLTTGFLLLAGTSQAYQFGALGWVNPNVNGSWNESTLSGTARYTFGIRDAEVVANGESFPLSVNTVKIFFENDIFAAVTGLHAVTEGWSLYGTSTTSTGTSYVFRTADPLAEVTSSSSPLTLDVDYVLLSADRYRYEWGMDGGKRWAWDEVQGDGGSWSQGFVLGWTMELARPGRPTTLAYFDEAGGSTAPVPEPGTLLLLGSGLAGLAWKRRRKS